MSQVTLMTPVSSFPDLPEISESEDSDVEDKGYFTSSISSLMQAPESKSCCCPSLREKLFPSLETKFFKIMQKEDFLPFLIKLRESIKDNAKLQRFYDGLFPLILDNPQIFYDLGIKKDVAILSSRLADRLQGMLNPNEKVDFFLQLYKLEERYSKAVKTGGPVKPDLLEPLLTRYMERSNDFELFEDATFLCIFHNKSCQLKKEVLLELIAHLEENGKLFQCIEILTLAELKKEKDAPFRSTNLLSQITAVYGAQVYSPVLIRLEQNLVDFLSDIDDSVYQHEIEEVSKLSIVQQRKSTKVVRRLEKDDFADIFAELKRNGFPEIEEKNQRFYALVDKFFSELYSIPFSKAGKHLLLQRKEILERKGFNSKAVGVYLGEILFLRLINPHLTNSKNLPPKAVLQLAKILQIVANHNIYDDFNYLSWMNPYLGEFSGQFDNFIADLEYSKSSKMEVSY